MTFIEARNEHIPLIQSLASKIWPETFSKILSSDQIKYMMEMMYSSKALKEQIDTMGHCYILAEENNDFIGYLSYETNYKNTKQTKIHKIYLQPSCQGKGLGRKFIDAVEKIAAQNNDMAITLNVNRYNKALNFYQHIGFEIKGSEDIDIGDGFLMEDYVMVKQI